MFRIDLNDIFHSILSGYTCTSLQTQQNQRLWLDILSGNPGAYHQTFLNFVGHVRRDRQISESLISGTRSLIVGRPSSLTLLGISPQWFWLGWRLIQEGDSHQTHKDLVYLQQISARIHMFLGQIQAYCTKIIEAICSKC